MDKYIKESDRKVEKFKKISLFCPCYAEGRMPNNNLASDIAMIFSCDIHRKYIYVPTVSTTEHKNIGN